jgi:hypothetical protein
LLGTYPFSLVAGNLTTLIPLDPLNYTRNKTLTCELTLSAIGGTPVVGDTLDVKLQETRSPTQAYWDTRGYFYQVLGNQATSAGNPYADQFTVSQDINLVAPDRNERPTGSRGGVEIPPGTVRDGPFAPRLRSTLGLIASHRLVLIQAGSGQTSSWQGVVQVFGHHP